MKGALVALLFFLPKTAFAEVPSRQEFSFLSSFLQMIAALAIVVGLILIARHFSGRLLGQGLGPRLTSRYIRIVETRCIAPKKNLVIVEIGGEYFLLADAENGVSFLKQVNVIEEIEVVDDVDRFGSGVAEFFRRNCGKRSG